MGRAVQRILVADDSAHARGILVFLLRSRGYEVLESEDGERALARARSERPDLVILDAMMPGRSGFEVCAALRADPALRGLPVVLLTAMGPDAADLGARAGADECVFKPFRVQDLLARIEARLAGGGGQGA
jgi:DNA-binding response OmpR family regulator